MGPINCRVIYYPVCLDLGIGRALLLALLRGSLACTDWCFLGEVTTPMGFFSVFSHTLWDLLLVSLRKDLIVLDEAQKKRKI